VCSAAARSFPDLVILSGVEVGEPHWHSDRVAAVLGAFGSDARSPVSVGDGFAEAVAMVEALGCRPGRHPYDRWCA
jgi:hypothetical protein